MNNNTTPEKLLEFLTKPQMLRCAVIALVVHVVLLLATSTGFLQDAMHYGTVDVKGAKAAEKKAAADKAEAERKAAALKKAEETAKKQEEERQKKAAEEKKAAEATAARQAASPTMKATTDVSKERPQTTSMELDLDSL